MLQRSIVLLKPKKRQKSGAPFIKASQTWRDKWMISQAEKLATQSKNYVEHYSTKRTVPWDSRFRPFDRSEKDGVYHVMKYLMEDKLAAANNHAKPTRKLFCNVGLLGPNFGSNGVMGANQARFKPRSVQRLPHDAKFLEELKTACWDT